MNKTKEERQKARLTWVQLYQEVQDAGLVCSRCGISRPTLRKWLKRYAEGGKEALIEESRKPYTSPKLSLPSSIGE